MTCYAKLIQFGNTAVTDLPVYNGDPLTYCIGNNASQRFNHGSNAATYGQNSNACQIFMAQRCAAKWDPVCEYASSHAANEEYATRADTLGAGSYQAIDLTPGEILIRNTAMEKYRANMYDCQVKAEPFNAVDPASPMIYSWVGQNCVAEYEIADASTIDADPVMNKILDRPQIAKQLLTNIKNTMQRKGTLGTLVGTRLGAFYGLTSANCVAATATRTGNAVVLPRGNAGVASTSTTEDFRVFSPGGSAAAPFGNFNDYYSYGFPTTTTAAYDPFSPDFVSTMSGLVPIEYVDWWPTQYVDTWPDEYDGAWLGSNYYGGGDRFRSYGGYGGFRTGGGRHGGVGGPHGGGRGGGGRR